MKTYNSLKSKKGDMLYSPLFLIVIESDYLCKESQARSPSGGKKQKRAPKNTAWQRCLHTCSKKSRC